MDIEAQIEATARLLVEIEPAVTQVKVDPRVHGVVDRSRQLPVAMDANAKATDIAMAVSPNPLASLLYGAAAAAAATYYPPYGYPPPYYPYPYPYPY